MAVGGITLQQVLYRVARTAGFIIVQELSSWASLQELVMMKGELQYLKSINGYPWTQDLEC